MKEKEMDEKMLFDRLMESCDITGYRKASLVEEAKWNTGNFTVSPFQGMTVKTFKTHWDREFPTVYPKEEVLCLIISFKEIDDMRLSAEPWRSKEAIKSNEENLSKLLRLLKQ